MSRPPRYSEFKSRGECEEHAIVPGQKDATQWRLQVHRAFLNGRPTLVVTPTCGETSGRPGQRGLIFCCLVSRARCPLKIFYYEHTPTQHKTRFCQIWCTNVAKDFCQVGEFLGYPKLDFFSLSIQNLGFVNCITLSKSTTYVASKLFI